MFSSSPPNKRLRRLRRFVAGQKFLEGLAAFLAGAHAGSAALVAFALVSSADLVGILTGRGPERKTPDSDPLTLRLLGVGAFGAGGYVLLRSSHAILEPAPPVPTLLGEGIVEFSIMLTVGGFWAARRLLPSSHFDPIATLKWAGGRLLLAVSTLAGLVLNATLDLWMADPLSALPVAGFFFYTGERLLRENRANRTSLPETGELLASIVSHIGTKHAGQFPLRIIVCGGGGLGLQTARALVECGHDVSIIEEDVERCRALKEENTGAIVTGNATRPDVLRRAGIKDCDVVAALSGDAKANHRICRAAEQEAPVRTVMCAPFAAEADGGQAGVRSLGGLDEDLRILELRVAIHAPIAGQRPSDIQFPNGGRVLSTAAGDSIDEAETVFAPGECYVVVASEQAVRAMTHLFRGQHRSKPSV